MCQEDAVGYNVKKYNSFNWLVYPYCVEIYDSTAISVVSLVGFYHIVWSAASALTNYAGLHLNCHIFVPSLVNTAGFYDIEGLGS